MLQLPPPPLPPTKKKPPKKWPEKLKVNFLAIHRSTTEIKVVEI